MDESDAKDAGRVGAMNNDAANAIDKLVQLACHDWLNASQIHHLLSLALLDQVPVTTIPKQPQSKSVEGDDTCWSDDDSRCDRWVSIRSLRQREKAYEAAQRRWV